MITTMYMFKYIKKLTIPYDFIDKQWFEANLKFLTRRIIVVIMIFFFFTILTPNNVILNSQRFKRHFMLIYSVLIIF